MNVQILWVCLGTVTLAVLIYWLSSNKIYNLNKGENDEFEEQVGCLEIGSPMEVHDHFTRLMHWKIKLFDLETINFFGVWLGLSADLIISVVLLGNSDETTIGTSISTIMYVFGFIESVVSFPVYYQQLVRLNEIACRLQ